MNICDLRNLEINILEVCKQCRKGCKKNFLGNVALTEVFGGDCPLIIHSTYPYRVSLKGGGYFDWVQPGDGVIVQCASSEPAVITKTFEGENRNAPSTKVEEIRDICPHNYKKGDQIARTHSNVCEDYWCNILPFIFEAELGQQVTLSCPDRLCEYRLVVSRES